MSKGGLTAQQNSAGSLRVSLRYSLLSHPERVIGGHSPPYETTITGRIAMRPYTVARRGVQRGLISNVDRLAPGFASLYPPYTWIPASAGMTEESCRDSSLPGAWGCPPDTLFFSSPKNGGQRGLTAALHGFS